MTTNPDILVYTHVVLSEQTQWNATSMGGFGYRGWGGMGGGMATATETKIPDRDPGRGPRQSRRRTRWSGAASRSDQVSASGAEQGQVQDAVAALFKNFPPKPGQ